MDPKRGVRLGVVRNRKVLDVTEPVGTLTDLLSHPRPEDLLSEALETADPEAGWSFTELDAPPRKERAHLLAPLDRQEVWAAGVTYRKSREARMEESKTGGDFYDQVYDADRPELFFKATPNRAVGPNVPIIIRRDSTWNVPEPELTLVISPRKHLVGFTIGNDVSSRSIEGENPLYLPQAKVYVGCAAVGPVITLAGAIQDPMNLTVALRIARGGHTVFRGETSTERLKRSLKDLIGYLGREQSFPYGAMLMTGTGVVPANDFTLRPGDEVEIEIDEIGTLRNAVKLGTG